MTLTSTAIAPPSSRTSHNPVFNPFMKGQAHGLEDAFVRRTGYAQLGAAGGRIVQLAKGARYVLCRKDSSISVWALPDKQASSSSSLSLSTGTLDQPKDETRGSRTGMEWRKLLEMELKVDTTIVSSALSEDGRWIAVSDAYETKLFRLIPAVGQIFFISYDEVINFTDREYAFFLY